MSDLMADPEVAELARTLQELEAAQQALREQARRLIDAIEPAQARRRHSSRQ